ncbi:MAG: hypothetical protein NNA31_01455 [Nitrospira sp.]|nr:hypothetical protein [Nitrospira sp.]
MTALLVQIEMLKKLQALSILFYDSCHPAALGAIDVSRVLISPVVDRRQKIHNLSAELDGVSWMMGIFPYVI